MNFTDVFSSDSNLKGWWNYFKTHLSGRYLPTNEKKYSKFFEEAELHDLDDTANLILQFYSFLNKKGIRGIRVLVKKNWAESERRCQRAYPIEPRLVKDDDDDYFVIDMDVPFELSDSRKADVATLSLSKDPVYFEINPSKCDDYTL